MKKIVFTFLAVFMLLGTVTTLIACKSEAETQMEKNLQDAKDASQRLKEIEKEVKDILNKP